MPTTVDALRTYGTRRVTVVTRDGEFDGRFAQTPLSELAVMALFVSATAPDAPIVIALDAIDDIVER